MRGRLFVILFILRRVRLVFGDFGDLEVVLIRFCFGGSGVFGFLRRSLYVVRLGFKDISYWRKIIFGKIMLRMWLSRCYV